MPALHFLRRKWLIACDDFVIPCFLDALLRFIWCVLAFTVAELPRNLCQSTQIEVYSLYGVSAYLFFSSSLSLCISCLSARGAVLEAEKRSLVSKLLYVRLLFLVCDVLGASYGVWLFGVMKDRKCYGIQFFLKASTVVAWIYVILIIGGIIVCFDSLGSTRHHNTDGSSLYLFRKAQYIWRMRLKLFCCCADVRTENNSIYVEVSTFLASFLNGIDLVPSDILAGIITLSRKHFQEREKHIKVHLPISVQLLKQSSVPDWMTSENALYYLRIAKSTYGWMAFFNAFQPWKMCALVPYTRCCTNSQLQGSSPIIQDTCFQLNVAAICRIAGFHRKDILHLSFSRNSIHKPAFYVAVHHPRKALIIAVRGTCSFSDLMTDIDAGHQPFPSGLFQCHRGALQSALYLQKSLQESGVMEKFFAENPGYTLALTGHSLGGSVVALLSLLLLPTYPDLQCYAYGPLAAISATGVPALLNHVLSIVVGVDLAPRLCAKSCVELRKQIVESLSSAKLPKYKLLSLACLYHAQKFLNVQAPKRPQSGQENALCIDEEATQQESISISSEDKRLYAPGRILYFEKNNWNHPYWLSGLNLQTIVVNPDMISDHQPRRIQDVLESYVDNWEQISHL